MPLITIERVTPATAHLLDRVAPGVFNDPIDPMRLDFYFAQSSTMLLVACDGALVVGQVKAAIHWHPDKAADLYLDELRVAPSHQRQGLARRLLSATEDWARERGCTDIWLATGADNEAGQSLYRSFAESRACLLFYWDL